MYVVKGSDHFGIKELLGGENIDWDNINTVFLKEPSRFEDLLFKIHFKRKKELPAAQRSGILHFLSIGYSATDDIRYFNEFLWFYKDDSLDKELMDGCMERFNSNLNEKGCHRLTEQLNKFPPDINGRELTGNGSVSPINLRICLIGFPPFFGSIIKNLRKDGHYVEQFFLPYHPNRYVNRILKFKIAVKLITILSGNRYSYQTLNYDHKDGRIGEVLKRGNFDIGFHKLNFIIRENIFNAFRIGLLNDHWGYLPLLRGKSTIAYSVLLNIPVISTIHFINSGIDSGPIAGYWYCDYRGAGSVTEIRNSIRRTMPERIVNAIKYAGSNTFTPKENKPEAGVTFYEMHPWLDKHINSRILKQ